MPTDPPPNRGPESPASNASDGATKPRKQARSKKVITVAPDLTPSEIGKAAPAKSDDPTISLDEYQIAHLEAELNGLEQQLVERKDIHTIRRRHAWLLFGLTVFWIGVVWLIVLLQGFGQWFLPHPAPASGENYLMFKLSDTVLIAFMTSTTATVLGLYGIAAYWMYGHAKKKPKRDAAARQRNSKPGRRGANPGPDEDDSSGD